MEECNEVVRHSPIARPNLGGFDPLVFGETGINREVLVFHYALGWDVEWLRHAINHVGLRNPPAFDKRRKRRQIGRAALRAAILYPGANQLFVALRQAIVVKEFSMLGIGMPGRHATFCDHLANRLGPADNFVVRG